MRLPAVSYGGSHSSSRDCRVFASMTQRTPRRSGRVLGYLDVPFQRANPRILKLMKRPASGEKISSVFRRGVRPVPTSRFGQRSSSSSPVRRRPSSKNCLIFCKTHHWIASGVSHIPRSTAQPLMTCRVYFPTKSRKSAVPAAWMGRPRFPKPCRAPNWPRN